MSKEFSDGTWMEGRWHMGRCATCGQIVRLNKTLFGSMHLCLTDEEIENEHSRQRKFSKADKRCN